MLERSREVLWRRASLACAILVLCCAEAVDVTNVPDDARLTVRTDCQDTIPFTQTCQILGFVQFETMDLAIDRWRVDLIVDQGSLKRDTLTRAARLTTNSAGQVFATIYPPPYAGDIIITLTAGGRSVADTLHVKDTVKAKP
jgi:hypothetical protein